MMNKLMLRTLCLTLAIVRDGLLTFTDNVPSMAMARLDDDIATVKSAAKQLTKVLDVLADVQEKMDPSY